MNKLCNQSIIVTLTNCVLELNNGNGQTVCSRRTHRINDCVFRVNAQYGIAVSAKCKVWIAHGFRLNLLWVS